jgi:hypothetical protein
MPQGDNVVKGINLYSLLSKYVLNDEARTTWIQNDRQRHSDCQTQRRPMGHWTDAEIADSKVEFEQFRAFDDAMRRVLFKAKKLKATTAAGIYAKALIVRSSQSGANCSRCPLLRI